MSLNYALSDDGLHWRVATTPAFWGRSTCRVRIGFWYTAMEYHAGTYYLYIETGIGGHTSIFAATHEGALPPISG